MLGDGRSGRSLEVVSGFHFLPHGIEYGRKTYRKRGPSRLSANPRAIGPFSFSETLLATRVPCLLCGGLLNQ